MSNSCQDPCSLLCDMTYVVHDVTPLYNVYAWTNRDRVISEASSYAQEMLSPNPCSVDVTRRGNRIVNCREKAVGKQRLIQISPNNEDFPDVFSVLTSAKKRMKRQILLGATS